MNRNSNVYTVIYATVLTVLVAVLLSVAALSLKDKQKANTDNEKKQQILMAISEELGKEVTFDNAAEIWSELKMDENMLVVNTAGQEIEGNAFDITPKAQFKAGEVKDDAELPVFKAQIGDNTYYIMCMYGAGLWDAIWGFVAVDMNGIVKGCSFDHAGETAGLGAKIKDDPNFAKAFIGKRIWNQDGELASVDVNKPGKANRFMAGGEHVDCITGATKTSDCVSVMMYNSLKGYESYLNSLTDCTCGEGEEDEARCTNCESCECDPCECEDLTNEGQE